MKNSILNSLIYQYWAALITSCLSFLHLASCTDDDNSFLFSRYDPFAYLSARDGNVVLTDGSEYRHKDDILKLLHTPRPPAMDDPEQSCTTYLAPSSIPNSGLGMYTTISYSKGESYPFPDIGIMLQEMSRHYTSKKGTPKVKLLAQYPWAAKTLTFGQYEVYYGESMAPSLGMLANSHLGLVNIRHSELWAIQHWRDGTDSFYNSDTLTKEDVGRGAYSHHGHVTFEISANIQAGEELVSSELSLLLLLFILMYINFTHRFPYSLLVMEMIGLRLVRSYWELFLVKINLRKLICCYKSLFVIIDKVMKMILLTERIYTLNYSMRYPKRMNDYELHFQMTYKMFPLLYRWELHDFLQKIRLDR